MKLNIIPPTAKSNKPKMPNGYESPFRYWHVTTEADVEGRKTLDLGYHYGHVAAIAFELANKCGYTLQFRPASANDFADVRAKDAFHATNDRVWISLGAEANFSNRSAAEWKKWLDTDDVTVHESFLGTRYYGGIYLKLPTASTPHSRRLVRMKRA